MAKNNAIGILFGVEGGSNKKGASAVNIRNQLLDIAKTISLKIKVELDENSINKQIKSIKKSIDSKIAQLQISIPEQKNNKQNTQSDGLQYEKAKNQLQEIFLIKKQIAKLELTGKDVIGDEYGIPEYQRLKENYKNKEAISLLQIDDIDIKEGNREEELIKTQTEAVFDLIDAKAKALSLTTEETEKLKEQGEILAKNFIEYQETERSKITTKKYDGTQELQYSKITANATRLLERNKDLIKSDKDAAKVADELREKIEKPFDSTMSTEQIKSQMTEIVTLTAKTDKEFGKLLIKNNTLGNKILKTFSSKVIQVFSYAIIGLAYKAISQVYTNVVKLDKAITNLQIATGKTREETKNLVKSYGDLAKQLGATILEVSDAADTWLRQGYSISETNKLITNTIMLSKLGQLESAEASRALTSAMKGYNIEAEESIKIVDKLTAVDMKAAVTAGGIATSMAETATSADIAGVSMDRLIGYIATVSEVTQDGAESVGIFYKTLFSRMGNVKAGKFIDDETGESLNDVEKVLSNLKISLRDESGLFKDFGSVLDEVGSKWSAYDNVEQHALATAFAGTRNQEKFIVLMNNYGTALKYATESANSAGTATSKYNDSVMQGIDSKINSLTASWEAFSQEVLNGEIIKFIVDTLTNFSGVLTKILGVGDGILIIVPAIVISLYTLLAVILKIKASLVGVKIIAAFKSVVAIIPAIITGLQAIQAKILGLATATDLVTAAQAKLKAALPFLLTAGVAIGVVIIKALSNIKNGLQEASNEADKFADSQKEMAESAKKNSEDLASSIKEYKDIMATANSETIINSETRQRILDIQTKINELSSGEIKNIDLINDKYDDNIKKLLEIQKIMAKEEYEKTLSSYSASIDASNKARPSYVNDNVSGFNFFGALDASKFYDIVLERGNDVKDYENEVYDIISKMDDSLLINRDAELGDKFYGIKFNTENLDEKINSINSVVEGLQSKGANTGNSEVYRAFVQIKQELQDYYNSQNNATNSLLQSATSLISLDEYSKSDGINSLSDYKELRKIIISSVKNNEEIKRLLDEGIIKEESVTSEVDNWLAKYSSKWYEEFQKGIVNNIVTVKSFLDILNETNDEFDALNNSLNSLSKNGVVAESEMKKILETYPDLMKYFELTNQGYVKSDKYSNMSNSDVLSNFATEYLQQYVDELSNCIEGTENYKTAQENLNTAIATMATLIRTSATEDEKENLENEKELLNDKLQKYKDLISIRKDLLQSYKDEINVQEELANKQKKVADLQTKLALSKLDNTESGKANSRKIESELNESKEDLKEYTFDLAVKDMEEYLDSSDKEYESFIKTELDNIAEKIDNISKNISVDIALPKSSKEKLSDNLKETIPKVAEKAKEFGEIVWGGIKGFSSVASESLESTKNGFQNLLSRMFNQNIKKYHNGGFVGEINNLNENEQYAKLLNGEYVATPEQIKTFVNKTLPSIASNGVSNISNFNEPLIKIECGNLSNESLPDFKRVLNDAVSELKTQMDNAFNRTGHSRKSIKFST